ncbi:MAG: hypothetical protein ACTSYB_06025 [Candidatus Helarchaeota archaeon]
MCNSCYCENWEKCSARGHAPIGFCCSHCDNYSPLNIPCGNKYQTTKTKEYLVLKKLILSNEIL